VIKEGITHNLLISDPIMHPGLYQFPRGNPDPDVLQIIFAGGVGMIVIVFAQYSVGMGICLNLHITGTPAIDPLALNLSFPRHLFHTRFSPSQFVTRATESLAC
jgi:hypothetical protein